MTIICAMQDEGCAWIGSDTLSVNTDDELIHVGSKWVCGSGWGLGVSGNHKTQLVINRHAAELFDGLDDIDELCERLAKIFTGEDFKRSEDKLGAPFWGGWYVAATAARIWTLDSTLAAVEFEVFAAEGQGSQFAKGVAYAAQDLGWSGEKVVRTAIEAACTHLTTCGGEPWVQRLT